MPTDLKDPDFIETMYQVSDWDDVNALLRSPSILSERKLYRPSLHNVLVNINGDEHLRRRQIESPVFNRDALLDYERRVLHPILDEYAAKWIADGKAELVSETLLLLSRIGARLTGVDGITTDGDAQELVEYADAFAAAGSAEWAKLPPEEVQRLIDGGMEARARFEQRRLAASRDRRADLLARAASGEIASSELPVDIITTMLRNWQDHWEPELLALEVMMFLAGSIRTSMRVVCNSIQEIHDWMLAHPEDEHLRQDSTFIRAAISETLRLHTITPLLIRLTADDIVLPSGRTIPKDEYVAVLYARANRDPKAFGDDAAEFDPHRGERATKGRDYGVSFAAGAHACIGRRLAVGGGAGESGSNGSVVTIVTRLIELGAAPDPRDPAVPNEATFYDEYTSYPVRLAGR